MIKVNDKIKENIMNIITRKYSFFQMLAGVIFMGWSAASMAHHPEIIAEAACDTGSGFVINYTSTSWLTTGGSGSGNTRIDILLNGVVVDSGSFSGPDYSFSGSVPAPTNAVGGDSVIVTALAVDNWDNGNGGGQSTATKVILPDLICDEQGTGRFTGGGHQIRVDGVRVTRGLTIHCDLSLSNNLQINWNGNKFHMTEHLITTQCSDSPEIVQFPPDAPLDTLKGVGTGRYQNQDGYTIEFTLVDAGEPGSMDEMSILIYDTSTGEVVLDVPQQRLDGGNLQAHYDQPHK